jgi:hypothetical protein
MSVGKRATSFLFYVLCRINDYNECSRITEGHRRWGFALSRIEERIVLNCAFRWLWLRLRGRGGKGIRRRPHRGRRRGGGKRWKGLFGQLACPGLRRHLAHAVRYGAMSHIEG